MKKSGAALSLQEQNTIRADWIIEALLRLGAGPFFIAPGARSIPLVAALVRSEVPDLFVLTDERTAGFAAVGAARTGHVPVVVTTSGTATANLTPALFEARASFLPFIALTADRPWEDHGIGANQTVDQVALLKTVTVAQCDLPAPNDGADDHAIVKQLGALWDRSTAVLYAGPAHLNVRFRPPLEPAHPLRNSVNQRTIAPKKGATAATAKTEPTSPPTSVLQRSIVPQLSISPPSDRALASLRDALTTSRTGLLVVGQLSPSEQDGARAVVDALPWPCLADIVTGIPPDRERGRLRPAWLGTIDKPSTPDLVLWIGGRLLDPSVAAWLLETGSQVIQLSHHAELQDANRLIRNRCLGNLLAAAGMIASCDLAASALLEEFSVAARSVAAPRSTTSLPPLSEPWVAKEVVESARPGDALLLGNSMPVRDADRFAKTLADDVLLFSNRGASGIDGHLGTALGLALASGRPTTALLGDLTLLHDVGGLAALQTHQPRLRIVVINNGGGGIFSLLPVGQQPALLDPWISAPHDLGVAKIAAAFGVRSQLHRSPETFLEALFAEMVGPELHEVRTERGTNAELRRRLEGVDT